jgi:putative two-component system response regulator
MNKPIDAPEVRARTKNMLAIRRGPHALRQRPRLLEQEVARATAKISAREQEIIVRLSRAAEYRDLETGAHIVRVAAYSRIIARHLDRPEDEQDLIFQATPMHDVGKIGVPDEILLKAGRLDEAEFTVMQQHTTIGHGILCGSTLPLLELAAQIALTHHERYDGKGYPAGLAGEDIPLAGRIVAVADVFDALTSRRPYKREWAVDLALTHLREQAGVHFDPKCIGAFEAGLEEILIVRSSTPDPAQPEGGQGETLPRFSVLPPRSDFPVG